VQKSDDKKIIHEFRVRQGRQFLAIAVTLLLLVFLSVLYKRPDLFGEFSKGSVSLAQIATIAAFIGFSALNWRCPSCKKYLGHNINRQRCRQCGTRLR
jgi:uncharacterized paraquat-inducible protein A